MDFTDARHAARMTRDEVAAYLEISPRTIKRYEQTGKAPKAVIECLLMIGGKCPSFSRRNDFTGWSFGNGFLWSPGGDRYTSGDVLASRGNQQMVDGLYRENLKLRREMKAFNKPVSNVIQFPIKRQKHDDVA